MPSKCELQVSIWRLTDHRQVWYEWYAEAFLPLPGATPSYPRTPPREPLKLRVPTPKVGIEGSPLIDAIDLADGVEERPPVNIRVTEDSGSAQLIKIGQTTLHNPRGRSSWIGL